VSPTKLPHCAVLARQLGERPTGTASRIRSVLLIEHTGTWPVDVRERLLTECFGSGAPERMDELHVRLGLRALVIRRPGRQQAPSRFTVMVGGFAPGRRWLERLTVEDYGELSRLDTEAIAHGVRGWGEPVSAPQFLVCAHGRKDACCAMLGRPVADALSQAYPAQTWQCTHFGGDRWAGNLLVAPHGFMYGQLEPGTALPAAAAALRDEVSLDNLRGRTGIDPFAQVAEIAVRERTGLRGLDDALAGPVHTEEGQTEVEVATSDGSSHRVRMCRRPLGVHGQSACSGEAHPHRFDVLGMDTTVPA
jgi:hypothetical protein